MLNLPSKSGLPKITWGLDLPAILTDPIRLLWRVNCGFLSTQPNFGESVGRSLHLNLISTFLTDSITKRPLISTVWGISQLDLARSSEILPNTVGFRPDSLNFWLDTTSFGQIQFQSRLNYLSEKSRPLDQILWSIGGGSRNMAPDLVGLVEGWT